MTSVSMLQGANAETEFRGGFQPQTQRLYTAIYTGAAAAIVTVTVADDVIQLQNRGWIKLPGNGTTAQRPPLGPFLSIGDIFNDSTIGCLVTWDGESWRDILTGVMA